MSILTERLVVADQENAVCVTERKKPSYNSDFKYFHLHFLHFCGCSFAVFFLFFFLNDDDEYDVILYHISYC